MADNGSPTRTGNQVVIDKSGTQDVPKIEDSILEGDVRWQLATRIARAPMISRATQLQAILLFIVRMDILKPEEPIRESDIAYRVLGRRGDFNPMEDTIVRVQMAHLRKKLDHYFSADGKDEQVVISVALGSYKPIFTDRSKSDPAVDLLLAARAVQNEHKNGIHEESDPADGSKLTVIPEGALLLPHRPGWRLTGLIALSFIALALAVACVILSVQNSNWQRSNTPWRSEPVVAAFWSSFLDSNRATDIVMGDHTLLLIEEVTGEQATLNDYVHRSFQHQGQDQATGQERSKILGIIGKKNLRSANEVRLVQRFLILDPLEKNLHIYGARDFTADLVGHDNVILVGNRVTNPWQELFDQQLNFSLNTQLGGIDDLRRFPEPTHAC